MDYKIAETFYSLIGEGEWTGCAAYFIRLAGCNLNCKFCDTDYKEQYKSSAEELFEAARQNPARKVVITGGEPTIHILKPLTDVFRLNGFKVHLETNGILTPDSLDFDWIAVSPKPGAPIDPFMAGHASEVKFLCGSDLVNWERFLEENIPRFPTEYKWLMPIADGLYLDHVNMKLAKDYCLAEPMVKLCIQMHKVVGIR